MRSDHHAHPAGPGLADRVREKTGVDVARCYQCGKCSAGCPLSADMDFPPSQVMHLLQLAAGFPEFADLALRSHTIWLCLTCEICYARCPMDLDIPKVMDALRHESLAQKKVNPRAKDILAFHRAFLDSLRYTGRLFEMGQIVDYKLRSRPLPPGHAAGALDVFRRQAAPAARARPQPPPAGAHLRPDPEGQGEPLMKTGFYPGCSMKGSAREYSESLLAVAAALGCELPEVPDWNCCGATAAHNLDPDLALALPARILAAAEKAGMDEVLVPCAACYSRLSVTRHELLQDDALRRKISGLVEADYRGTARVVNIIEWLAGIPGLENRVKAPFARRVACYYGCLLVRPAGVVEFRPPRGPADPWTS